MQRLQSRSGCAQQRNDKRGPALPDAVTNSRRAAQSRARQDTEGHRKGERIITGFTGSQEQALHTSRMQTTKTAAFLDTRTRGIRCLIHTLPGGREISTLVTALVHY